MEPGLEDLAPQPTRRPKYTKLTQQQLPAYQPVLDPVWVVFVFFAISVIFITLGGICYAWGVKANEVVYRYDNLLSNNESRICWPANITAKEIQERIWQSDEANDTSNKTCLLKVTLNGTWHSPIFVYYQLDGFYQNHRRYHKSRSDAQLANSPKPDLKTCDPKDQSNNKPILPCGLIAWSYFNDTFTVNSSSNEANPDFHVDIRGDNIAPKADVKERFANILPSNFYPAKPSERGGANISTTLKDDERFIIWMRTAALPRFRKLWGRIELEGGESENTQLVVEITNQYNSFSYHGSKSLVFATTTWLGGRTRFLGLGYLITGGTSLLMATVYALLYAFKRPSLEDSS